VIGRAIRWCLLSLSLLVLAPAALACNVATPQHDCCPGGEPTPCNSNEGGSVPAPPASASCCVAAPSSLPLTTLGVSARVRVSSLPNDLPDVYSSVEAPVLKLELPAIELSASSADWRYTPSSEPIYLLTRRLRL
jgi:hypothetical protein